MYKPVMLRRIEKAVLVPISIPLFDLLLDECPKEWVGFRDLLNTS